MANKRSSPKKIEVLESQLEEIHDHMRQMEQRVTELAHENELLRKALAGRKSERHDPNTPYFPELVVDQDAEGGESGDADEDGEDDNEDDESSSGDKKRGGSRKGRPRGMPRIPDHLPHVRREHEPPKEDQMCPCCGKPKVKIGESIRSRIEYVPASMIVVDDVKVKLACKGCAGHVSTAVAPPTPIERGLPGPGLLALVLTSKYAEHGTLYRLETVFERHQVELNRSTMCGWVAAACTLLFPIVDEMKRRVLQAHCVQTDETAVRVLGGPGVGGSERGRLWVYGGLPGDVVFDFTMKRSRDGPESFLGTRKGFLQADAWPGFNKMFRRGRLVEVGCWAHARRKFFDALSTAPRKATEVLGMIRVLYKIEAKADELGLDPHARRALRLKEAVPVLRMIKNWLKEAKKTVLPKSPLGIAVRYAVNQWRVLRRYTKDGRLSIDNNRSERAFRGVAIGRRNWLFIGSEAAAERTATILSLVQSCNELKIDPFVYLRDVLDLVSKTPKSRIAELTPTGWLARQTDKARPTALSEDAVELDERVRAAFAAAVA